MAARTGFSRFPVSESGETCVGYLHLKDALEFEDRHRNRPIARSWVRPLAVVNAADPLRIVLATMQRDNAHLARVDDTDGTVLGVAALEDVLEELVGEIRDDTQRVLARSLRLDVGEDRQHAPVVLVGHRKLELGEIAVTWRSTARLGHVPDVSAIARVRRALEAIVREHLALARA